MRPEASDDAAMGMPAPGPFEVSALSEKRTLFSFLAPVILPSSSCTCGMPVGALVITSSSPPACAAPRKRSAAGTRPPLRRAASGAASAYPDP